MVPQDIGGEVVFNVAPDGVDMIRAVLPVVELDYAMCEASHNQALAVW